MSKWATNTTKMKTKKVFKPFSKKTNFNSNLSLETINIFNPYQECLLLDERKQLYWMYIMALFIR